MAERGGYKHFMLKEIYEQPQAIADTLSINREEGLVTLEIDSLLKNPIQSLAHDFSHGHQLSRRINLT